MRTYLKEYVCSKCSYYYYFNKYNELRFFRYMNDAKCDDTIICYQLVNDDEFGYPALDNHGCALLINDFNIKMPDNYLYVVTPKELIEKIEKIKIFL